MRRPARRFWLLALISLIGPATALPAAMASAAPRGADAVGTATAKWTQISTDTKLGIASAGLWRTSDGKLHVVWAHNDGGSFSLHYSTVGGNAKLLNSGSIVTGWSSVSTYPRLAGTPGGGLGLVFTGGNGQLGSPYNSGAMYWATSTSAGATWTLSTGSLSHTTFVPLTDTAAATEGNGTPVAAWGGENNLFYHVNIDPTIPATGPDQTVSINSGSVAIGPTLARKSDGSVWMAWFTSSGKSDQGYWVDQLLPSKTPKVKAPSSGGAGLNNNQPLESVAFAARKGGGLYLAYCVPTKTVLCAHVDLWHVGASTAAALPGSATSHAMKVAIAAAPGGHMWVMWYDSGLNVIRVVRTNAAVTKFGPVRTLPAPPHVAQFDGLQAEGSQGPLDIVALDLNASGVTAYWDTQILPALKLTGSPASVSNTQATTVTFTVTDVGDAVAGATVKFLGKTVTTNSKGVASVTIPKGTAKGSYTAVATKGGYTSASFVVKVT